jgi:hypothetical protein
MNRIVHDLERVYLDNVSANQIGGLTDGISPEVASDLGYSTSEEVQQIIDNANRDAAVEVSRMRHPSGIGRTALTTETSNPTSAQQNANERAAIKAHDKRSQSQILRGQRV